VSDIRARGELGELVRRVERLAVIARAMHISAGTRGTYVSLQRVFIEFCENFGRDPLGLTEDDLCVCVVDFALGHTVRSVLSYVSAIQNLWDSEGKGPLPRGSAYLLTCRGLRRLLGTADVVVRTRALSLTELRSIIDTLDPTVPEDCCFALEMIVAFFLCLRTEDHVAGRLRWGHVYVQRDGSVEFLLPPGKIVKDYRHVACAARSDSLDVLLWLERLAGCVPAERRDLSEPLFVSFARAQDGGQRFWPISRNTFIHRLKAEVRRVLGVDPALYAGYSLRRGGVTELVAQNYHLSGVKRHVGWAAGSNAIYDYYDHHAKVQLLGPTRAMG
jgi:hypothetical protein